MSPRFRRFCWPFGPPPSSVLWATCAVDGGGAEGVLQHESSIAIEGWHPRYLSSQRALRISSMLFKPLLARLKARSMKGKATQKDHGPPFLRRGSHRTAEAMLPSNPESVLICFSHRGSRGAAVSGSAAGLAGSFQRSGHPRARQRAWPMRMRALK